MLENLSIRNFALIDSAEIDFSNGFTVLSGETGAGKSILIGAISFVLGGKAGVEQIRTGAGEATVSAVFSIKKENFRPSASAAANTGSSVSGANAGSSGENAEDDEIHTAYEWLERHGIELEDNTVLLRRFIRENGRGGAWIQNTPVTRTDLAEFSSFLIDIHGQHEHQSLMKVSEHRVFLDSWAGLTDEVKQFTQDYTRLANNRRRLAEISSSMAGREQKIEMLSFAINEINEAKLKKDEDVQLEEEEAKLSSFEKLYADIENVMNYLTPRSEGGIVSMLKKAQGEMSHAAAMDKSLAALESRLDSSFYELSDIAEEVRSYSGSLVFDPNRLAEVQERLALIYKLKKKYASSINASVSEVISYAEKAQQDLDALNDAGTDNSKLKTETEALERTVYMKAKQISEKRKSASEKMASQVMAVLEKLGMNGTRFAVNITEKEGSDVSQKCNPYGMDNVEFLISANRGSAMQGLAKIASGGELSRVMLALKTIFAQTDPVDTMIFDEIDTGIGGEIAVAVGSHMKNLSKNKQILCITHLASIAVYADNQIKVEKGLNGDTVRTSVGKVSGEQRVAEIARMLSGDSESLESREHARSMLEKYS